jgi:hypothetical protein
MVVSPTPPSPHRCVLPTRSDGVLLRGGRGQRATRSAAEPFLRALLASVVPLGTLDCCNGGCALADRWVTVFEARLAGGADVHDL